MLACVMLMSLAGCGGDAPDDGVAVDPREEPSVSESPTPEQSLPTMTPPTAPPSKPTDVFEKVRISGTVTLGADGCVELVDDNGIAWSLLGPATEGLADGERVTVTGRSQPEADRGGQAPCTGAPLTVLRVDPTR